MAQFEVKRYSIVLGENTASLVRNPGSLRSEDGGELHVGKGLVSAAVRPHRRAIHEANVEAIRTQQYLRRRGCFTVSASGYDVRL